MAKRSLALCALLICSSEAQAGKPYDIHDLIAGNEGARYVKGVPTLDLEQQRGAIQLRMSCGEILTSPPAGLVRRRRTPCDGISPSP
jgi:hypothetical protein